MEQMAKKMAAKSHREKVEEFNKKLANLSEHYDIPKVCTLYSQYHGLITFLLLFIDSILFLFLFMFVLLLLLSCSPIS